MADLPISGLPSAGALSGSEPLAIVQGGATKQTTVQDVADLAASGTVTSVNSGTNISVDNTNPAAPIINSLADRYKTTSTTSILIGNGSRTFTVSANLAYIPLQEVLIVYDVGNHMHGTVTSYSGTTLVVDVKHHTGGGTFADWVINLDGVPVDAITGAGTVNRLAYFTAAQVIDDAAAITSARALISDANGIPTHSATTSIELGYVSGVTSSIQTQLNLALTSVTGTTDRITVTGGSAIDIASTYVGQTSITTLGIIGAGTWNGTLIGSQYGGTGVNNSTRTITINTNNAAFTFAGAFTLTVPATGTATLGTGTSGQAAFWTGTNTVSSDSAFTWDNTNKRLRVGTVSPVLSRAMSISANTAANIGIEIINTSTSGGTALNFNQDVSNGATFNKNNSAAAGTFTGTSLSFANVFHFNHTLSATTGIGKTFFNGIIISGTGTTSSNAATYLDATGLLITTLAGITNSNTSPNRFTVVGSSFFGSNTTATAIVHLAAGTATASTAPLKFTLGTNLTTAEAGAMEYNGTNLFFTRTGTTRENVLVAVDNVAAPTTTAGVAITNYYGSSATNFLGTPDRWISVNILGTVYKIPLYN